MLSVKLQKFDDLIKDTTKISLGKKIKYESIQVNSSLDAMLFSGVPWSTPQVACILLVYT